MSAPNPRGPSAYLGPWLILSHRTQAETGPAVILEGEWREVQGQRFRITPYPLDEPAIDLRIDQDEADAAHAREQVHIYRVAGRQPVGDDPMMPRIWALAFWLGGLFGGAMIVASVIVLMQAIYLAFGK